MSEGTSDAKIIIKANKEDQASVLTASITVRLSMETNKGWMTIGAKGEATRVAGVGLEDTRRAKAIIISDANDIVRRCLWQADIALEKALKGELGDEVEDKRIHGVVIQGDTGEANSRAATKS